MLCGGGGVCVAAPIVNCGDEPMGERCGGKTRTGTAGQYSI